MPGCRIWQHIAGIGATADPRLNHACKQVAVVASQLASHCRRWEEMGVVQRPDFLALAQRNRLSVLPIPNSGDTVFFLKSPYLVRLRTGSLLHPPRRQPCDNHCGFSCTPTQQLGALHMWLPL